ncbi:MAG: hypothetical protein BWY42_01181 [Candidatus Omnitrophica bacterium ADurb.Bin277]|nr:MAG: hypothetical protein BWY42_01181 [Candidatus Omnitrophica bacterium ADurb.Bin277]
MVKRHRIDARYPNGFLESSLPEPPEYAFHQECPPLFALRMGPEIINISPKRPHPHDHMSRNKTRGIDQKKYFVGFPAQPLIQFLMILHRMLIRGIPGRIPFANHCDKRVPSSLVKRVPDRTQPDDLPEIGIFIKRKRIPQSANDSFANRGIDLRTVVRIREGRPKPSPGRNDEFPDRRPHPTGDKPIARCRGPGCRSLANLGAGGSCLAPGFDVRADQSFGPQPRLRFMLSAIPQEPEQLGMKQLNPFFRPLIQKPPVPDVPLPEKFIFLDRSDMVQQRKERSILPSGVHRDIDRTYQAGF